MIYILITSTLLLESDLGYYMIRIALVKLYDLVFGKVENVKL